MAIEVERQFQSMSNMKSVSLVLLVVFVTLSATTAKSVLQSRIINGKDATEGQFPHMVSISDRNRRHHCGATILSNRFVLTAAHCLQGSFGLPNNVLLVVGALRRSSGGVLVKVDAISAHKKFSIHDVATGIYDVGIIRTATEIVFNEFVQPVALPTVNVPEDRHVKVVVAGWGRHKYPSYDTPDVLQFTELDAINTTECVKRFAPLPHLQRAVQKENLCTIDSKHGGVCHGDSGSGLLDVSNPEHKIVVGIASWVYPCAKGYPDVFTRVYTQLDWIQKEIEKLSGDL